MQLTSPLVTVALLLTTMLNAQAPAWQWVSSGASTYQQYSGAVTCDPAGNSISCGRYQGDSIIFGSVAVHNTSFMPGNSPDAFISSYDPSGNLNWVRNVGGFYAEYANDISADANGNIYVIGQYDAPGADFDSINLPLAVGNTMYYAKYNSSGVIQWAKSVNPNPQANVWANSIDCDPAGNIYITGTFNVPSISFGSVVINGNSAGGMFAVKFDSNGNAIWGNGPVCDFVTPTDIQCDGAGNVYVTGMYIDTTITFGAVTLTNSDYSSGEVFVVKYNSAGGVTWAKTFAGTGADETFGLAVDNNGNTYLAGLIGNNPAASITFGSTVLTSQSAMDIFVAKLDPNGNALWAEGMINPAYHVGFGLDCDANGNAYVTGAYSDSLTAGAISVYGGGGFIVQYNSSGNAQWIKTCGAAVFDVACGSGVLFTAGWSLMPGTFDSFTFPGGVYVAKLSNLVGVEENAQPEVLIAYPNPATDFIRFTATQEDAGAILTISNAQGQTITSVSALRPGMIETDVRNYSAGLYILKIQRPDGTVAFSPFVVE